MDFKKGYTIKPEQVLPDGRVLFTDGTDGVLPNQISCEAYGYKWNEKEGTCTAFNYTNKIARLNKAATITKTDKTNIEESGTKSSTIIGTKNRTKGQNRNLLISGESNQVNTGIDNAVSFGRFGQVLRQGELVIGGGGSYSGIAQSSIVQLTGKTTTADLTNLTVQGLTTEYLEVQNNAVLGFEVKVIGICSGGSGGTAGHYTYQEIKGAVLIDNGYNTTFSQSTTTIASSGTTGSAVMADVTDPYITVKVTGTANVDIEWFASVQLTEKKLTTVTF
jgi:hypothetical protein